MIKHIDPAKNQSIRAGWLIDGTGSPVQQNVILKISAGKIGSIEKAMPEDFSRSDGVDLSGCTVMPGLIDSHVHLFMSGTDDLNVRRFQLEAGFADLKDLIESGCRSIEHGFFMGTENLKKMADKNIFWVPTAVTMHAFSRHLKRRGESAGVAQKNLDHQLEQIYAAKNMGVPIALGTDAGSLGVHHGRSVVEELKLLMKAGFTLTEAVRCATFNGAGLLRLGGLGSLVKGMSACFIATRGDPLNLPESLSAIVAASIQGPSFG